MTPAQEFTAHSETQTAPVHVEDHCKNVRDSPLRYKALQERREYERGYLLLVSDGGGVEGGGRGLVVVEGLQPTEVPAPAVGRVTQETLVADSMQGSLTGSHPHHGMGSSLSGRPGDFPLVETRAVAHLGPHTVRALGDGKPPHHQAVGVLQDNVERLVAHIPAVLPGNSRRHRGGVHQHGESLGQTS